MTTVAGAPAGASPAEAPSEQAPDEAARPRRSWRTFRKPLAVLAALLAAATLIGLMMPDGEYAELDPRSAAPEGGRGVTEVLRSQGIQVDTVTTTDEAVRMAGPDTTLLVADGSYLSTVQAERLRDVRGDIVLFDPPPRALKVLAPEVSLGELIDATRRQDVSPRCDLPLARRAGPVDAGGAMYETSDVRAITCYPQSSGWFGSEASGSMLVQVPRPGGQLTIVGKPSLLNNERLGERGNAALALGLLGGNDRLAWYIPSPGDVPANGEKQAIELLPVGVIFGVVMAAIAALVFALWRARRLGPVVAEPLPVVVRAAETAEGRARLYRRARAYDAAAGALRAATFRRVRSALGLGRSATPGEVADAAASRTGRPPQQVAYLLHGPPPANDAALVGLADELDRLDREVRHS